MRRYRLVVATLLLLITLVLLQYSIRGLSIYFVYKTKVIDKELEFTSEVIYKPKVKKEIKLTYDIFYFLLKNEFQKDKMKFFTPQVQSDEVSKLKTFRFTIDPKDIDSLNINLPESGKDHYVDAYMQVSDNPKKIRKVNLRYRGDNNFHWLYPQKSLRIKLSKKDTYNMEKKFNLINPPYDYTIVDIINYNISSKLGIIAPDYFPARVFINGNYAGVYMYLSQVDESLLRKHKLMPGSIYYGDNAPINKDGISNLWYSSKYWEKKASRNSEQNNNREDIEYFINSIQKMNHKEFYNFVNTMLDKDKYYKYFALDVIFGSEHHDYHHNHKIYFDPYRGKFQPIQWDLRFWHPYGTKDVSVYPLIQKISQNPILEYERDKVTYELMQENIFKLSNLKASLTQIFEEQRLDLEADPYKDRALYDNKLLKGWFSQPFEIADMNKTLIDKLYHYSIREKKLQKIFEDATISYGLNSLESETLVPNKTRLKPSAPYTYLLEVLSGGNSPVEIELTDKNISIYEDLNFNKKLDNSDRLVNGKLSVYPARLALNKIVEYFTPLLSGKTNVVPAKEYYAFHIKSNKCLTAKNFKFTNKITGKSVNAQRVSTIRANNLKKTSIHPWQLIPPKKSIKILEGNISVRKTLVFDSYTSVIIKPNTTFSMESNCSIFFYGKVEAIGTRQNPIRFIAKNKNRPWGIVTLQGQTTSNSRFEYCMFENGSVDTKNLIHYTSPFNIHDTQNFTVKHCTIGKNFIGDDAMHVAYANGTIEDSMFTDARSDGLDIDISKVTIKNCTFQNSGNDGLDIMTTKMNALNNTFMDTGDKGISVGEWSEANITNSTFTRTNIGVEIKDKSHVTASNLKFINSKEKAINLYHKNKRYDEGGFLKAKNLSFIGNSTVTVDKESKVTYE